MCPPRATLASPQKNLPPMDGLDVTHCAANDLADQKKRDVSRPVRLLLGAPCVCLFGDPKEIHKYGAFPLVVDDRIFCGLGFVACQ